MLIDRISSGKFVYFAFGKAFINTFGFHQLDINVGDLLHIFPTLHQLMQLINSTLHEGKTRLMGHDIHFNRR